MTRHGNTVTMDLFLQAEQQALDGYYRLVYVTPEKLACGFLDRFHSALMLPVPA